MPNKVKVHVEYCCSCLSTRYLELNLKILKECDKELLKNLKIDGKVGRRYTFEVTINDELVFSKLKTGAFPDFDAVNKINILPND